MMQGLIKLFLLAILLLNSCDGEVNATDNTASKQPPEDRQQCLQEFKNWCDNMTAPKEDEHSTVQVAYNYFDGNISSRIFCVQNSEGVNCLKNTKPWFQCFINNTLLYNGRNLEEFTIEENDNICQAKETALKFGSNVPIFNLSGFGDDMSNFFSGFSDMFEEFQKMKDMMTKLQNTLFGSGPNLFDVEDFYGDSIPATGENVSKEPKKEIDP